MQLLHSQDVAPQHFSLLWAELWVLLKHGHVKYVVLIILCAEKYFVFFHGILVNSHNIHLQYIPL